MRIKEIRYLGTVTDSANVQNAAARVRANCGASSMASSIASRPKRVVNFMIGFRATEEVFCHKIKIKIVCITLIK